VPQVQQDGSFSVRQVSLEAGGESKLGDFVSLYRRGWQYDQSSAGFASEDCWWLGSRHRDEAKANLLMSSNNGNRLKRSVPDGPNPDEYLASLDGKKRRRKKPSQQSKKAKKMFQLMRRGDYEDKSTMLQRLRSTQARLANLRRQYEVMPPSPTEAMENHHHWGRWLSFELPVHILPVVCEYVPALNIHKFDQIPCIVGLTPNFHKVAWQLPNGRILDEKDRTFDFFFNTLRLPERKDRGGPCAFSNKRSAQVAFLMLQLLFGSLYNDDPKFKTAPNEWLLSQMNVGGKEYRTMVVSIQGLKNKRKNDVYCFFYRWKNNFYISTNAYSGSDGVPGVFRPELYVCSALDSRTVIGWKVQVSIIDGKTNNADDVDTDSDDDDTDNEGKTLRYVGEVIEYNRMRSYKKNDKVTTDLWT